MANDIKSVLETIQSGTAWLEKRGVPEARLNMQYMLAHVLGLKRLDLYLQFDRPLGESELAPMRVLLQRRGKREPLQHLLGTVDFAGHEFKCDARGLIPRPETEQLAMRLLAAGPPAAAGPVVHVLDLGCGSGVLGLTLAMAWRDRGCEVVLRDLHADALALAEENAAALGLAAPTVVFDRGDLLDGLTGPIDVLVANLPYIPSAEIAGLDAEVAYDPVTALDGGPDGLDLIRRLATSAPAVLAPGGVIALEVGLGQGAAVAALLTAAGLADARHENDLEGADRFVFATRKIS